MKIRIVSVHKKCTAEKPMPFDISALEYSRWVHPDATTVYVGALFDEIECPHCGEKWKTAKT